MQWIERYSYRQFYRRPRLNIACLRWKNLPFEEFSQKIASSCDKVNSGVCEQLLNVTRNVQYIGSNIYFHLERLPFRKWFWEEYDISREIKRYRKGRAFVERNRTARRFVRETWAWLGETKLEKFGHLYEIDLKQRR